MKNISIKAPFTVPEGYFSALEDRVLSEASLPAFKAGVPVPKDYFSSLEKNVLAQVSMDKLNFTTPPEYFSDLEKQVMAQVKIADLQQPSVPDSYFSDLENRILGQVSMEALKELPVPAEYFTTLEAEILQKTAAPKRFNLFRNIYRNAAAVVILGITAYGFWNRPVDQLSDISSAEMIAYLSEQPLMAEDLSFVLEKNENLLTSEVSQDEISDYLMENGINI
jgi:hypothetical protein